MCMNVKPILVSSSPLFLFSLAEEGAGTYRTVLDTHTHTLAHTCVTNGLVAGRLLFILHTHMGKGYTQ